MGKFKIYRFPVFAVILMFTEVMHKVLSLTSCVLSLVASIILGLYLTWLIGEMSLRKLYVFALTSLNLFVVRFFSNMVEEYFFTSVFASLTDFIVQTFISLGISFRDLIRLVSLRLCSIQNPE